MSLFSRTSAQVDQLESLVKELDEAKSKPLTERKEIADSVNTSLSEIRPTVEKFVSKAEAGERHPNKRIYGTAMVSKIFALRDRFEAISSLFATLQSALLDEWSVHENEQREAENRRLAEEQQAEKKRLDDEKREKERRDEEERIQREKEREDAEKRKAEEAARQKAEQEREAEQKRLEAEKSAREKKLEEERAAAEAKKREEEASSAAAANAEKEKVQQRSSISISVRTPRGTTYLLNELPPKATVAELKETIERNHDVAKAAQRLIFQGRLLADANTIDSYKIKDGSTVHLVENPRAAAAAASASSSTRDKPLVPAGTVCHLRNGKAQLDEILKQCGNQRLVVIDWFAPWCGPCRAISPVFERLATRFSTVTFVKVDTEETAANAQLAAENSISAYPTFHFVLGQNVVHSFSGANAAAIENNIKKYRAMAESKESNADGFASGVGSSGGGSSGSGQGPISSQVMTSLLTLRRNLSMSDFIVAVRTLLTFVRNVVNNPSLEKYRRVRTANSTFQTRLGSRQGGMNCMRAFGFQEVTENGEVFLMMSAQAAAEPELRTVMGQLESALDQASGGVTSQPAAVPRATPTPMGAGLSPDAGGGMAQGLGGLGGMFGGGAEGVPSEAMWQLMQDPSFQQVASELAADPEAMGVIMQMQQAMTSGDIGAIQRLRSHPAMGRLQSALINNPTFLSTMLGRMGEQGFPNLGGLAGVMGMGGNDGGGTGGGGGLNDTPGTEAGNPGGGGNAEHNQAQFPGAPTTAEEEERLLQEAIRLSMQDQAGQEQREDGSDGDGGSKDKES